ncbi:alpha/beta fold hydrolase [Massilia sp. Root335]|uniref:alpha/beta fold hydrolase n=1 Tax=Massilia sp. Root335 TaxID=1736517 RepID=UPI0006FAEDCC|nr:alpha/beta hydrolase [Massilia sp. Root335]KQV33469.1 alpha/beta hydrolase [Massilia sp. Root335]
MLIDVNGNTAYAYTAGTAPAAGRPAIVFIHGAQNDHSVWTAQARALARQGHDVLAVDLPGHGRSAGPALATVDGMAAWLLALLDAAAIERAVLAGHSMGSLIALDAAARAPARVRGLALLGSTWPMKVSDALLETARTDEAGAIDMVNLWSHASIAPAAAGSPQGFWAPGASRRLMQRLSQLNPAQLFHTDFVACNTYAHGGAAAGAVACPTLFVQGRRDVMTPPRSAQALLAAIPHARVVAIDCGHAMMTEQPDAVSTALADFVRGLN